MSLLHDLRFRLRPATLAFVILAAGLAPAQAPAQDVTGSPDPAASDQAASDQAASDPAPESLGIEVTYTGNEGFLIRVGDKKILIDALYREGVSGYVVPSPTQREKMEGAQPPFDDVDLVLATHYDADHYHPDAIVSHLKSNPRSMFVTTQQGATALQRAAAGAEEVMNRVQGLLPPEGESEVLEVSGIGLEVLNLHHGRRRKVENAAFQVTVGGRKLLHLGDTEAVLGELRRHDLPGRRLDVIFVPFWYLLPGNQWQSAAREQLQAKHLVVMHLPAPDAGDQYIESLGGWDKVARDIQASYPNAVLFRQVMDEAEF